MRMFFSQTDEKQDQNITDSFRYAINLSNKGNQTAINEKKIEIKGISIESGSSVKNLEEIIETCKDANR